MESNWTGLLLLLWLCLSATCDALFRKIYNSVIVLGVFVYFILIYYDFWLTTSLLQSLAGFLLAFFVFLFFYRLNLMGAGDVKFGAVLGLFLGWKLFTTVWALSCFFCVLHGIYDKGFKEYFFIASGISNIDFQKKAKKYIPYVTYLCVATVVVLMLGQT